MTLKILEMTIVIPSILRVLGIAWKKGHLYNAS